MIPSPPINEHYHTYSCWRAARHSQARIRIPQARIPILKSPISPLANSARNSQRTRLQQLDNPNWAAKSWLHQSPSHLLSTAPVPKSP